MFGTNKLLAHNRPSRVPYTLTWLMVQWRLTLVSSHWLVSSTSMVLLSDWLLSLRGFIIILSIVLYCNVRNKIPIFSAWLLSMARSLSYPLNNTQHMTLQSTSSQYICDRLKLICNCSYLRFGTFLKVVLSDRSSSPIASHLWLVHLSDCFSPLIGAPLWLLLPSDWFFFEIHLSDLFSALFCSPPWFVLIFY
jgi:hypothetical protein